MALEALSRVLWRERELLELLLFKLEEEQLVLSGGRSRWLAHATREVELVLAQVREAEVARAAESDAVAADLGLPPGSSLRQLAAVAPAPWDELLTQHRDAFLKITAEVSSLAEDNRELVSQGARATREALAAIGATGEPRPQTYGRDGRRTDARRSHLVDEAL
jgi:hypothetical protein